MANASNDEAQLQIRFVTKQEQFAVADVPFAVAANIECKSLNTLINGLLREHQSDHIKDVEFDFLVLKEFLRTSLKEHLQERSASTEATIDVEYIERHPPPEPQDCLMHDDWVASVHVKEKWILSGCYDNSVNIWTTKGKLQVSVKEHTDVVKCVKWLPGGFVSVSHDQTALLWRWNPSGSNNSSVPEPVATLRGHERGVDCVAVSSDGQTLATGGWDTILKIWSASLEPLEEPNNKKSRSALTRTPIHSLKGHKETISDLQWTDSSTVVTASMDHTIKFWDTELCGIRNEIAGQKAFLSLSWSPLSKSLLTTSADRHVRLYDPRATEGILVKATYTSHTQWVQDVCWAVDNEYLFITAGYDNCVKLWDVRSPKASLYDLSGHEDKVLCCDWSNPDYMVSGSADNTVRIFKNSN